ncbi:protein of unknown function [Taphrina deformans PYCC 5710]|uniref:Altered inheritance of mitochondria protein 11 n=1 Tax=Taphrina deformans (strain PYCC 5710 / ATCC 11124 / CBS 356.35 / IMI 108563 / JCM 9778 / NBRC 8474) TaxID=1097556 RepID=R4X8L4_TAPDE|nr:protein of unknown function [Taphrina deformans PYCC 5710]|eukprot:CCG81958.1 protein of unknown function [Taphrina deformans PYCC 5710]
MSDRDTGTQYRFLLSSAAATFAVGVAFALRRVSRKPLSVPFFKSNAGHDPSFSPVLHAAQALTIGTALCLGSAGVLVGLGSYILDVRDLPSFSNKMRSLMKRTPVHRQLSNDLLDDDKSTQEWDRLWEEGRQIDAERAETKRLKKERTSSKSSQRGDDIT